MAQGGWRNGGWVELGLVAALGAALIKAETDNVVVARAKSGLTADPSGGDRALRPAPPASRSPGRPRPCCASTGSSARSSCRC